MLKILVTSIGSFSAESVINSLKKNNTYVVGCDLNPAAWLPVSYMFDAFYQVPHSNNSDLYIETLLEICNANNINHIIPLTDYEIDLLSLHKDYFEKKKIKICISGEPETINLCRDKYLVHE
jgi:carbamoyl-phosphate synthase large subunit